MSEFADEVQRWDDEVEKLAAPLIREGIPPAQAMNIANKQVSERRLQRIKTEKLHWLLPVFGLQ